MSMPRYIWRQLTPKQREEVLAWRKNNARPWHAPPHRPNYGHLHFLVSAACFEHSPHIGFFPQRMDDFSTTLLDLFQQHAARTFAWRGLPETETTKRRRKRGNGSVLTFYTFHP